MAQIIKAGMKTPVYEILKEHILSSKYNFGETISILGLTKELVDGKA